MTEKVLDASEIIDYADHNAGVLATSAGRLNPYKLGVELYRHIEERWNKGQFGKEWEECDDLDAKQHWNLRLGLGQQEDLRGARALQRRHLHRRVPHARVRAAITSSSRFGWSNRNERYEIETREFKAGEGEAPLPAHERGNPFIYVEDANYENRGELLLRHEHQGIDLRADYAREMLAALVRVWKRPVSVQTLVDGKKAMLRYDGKEHTTKQES